MAGRSTRSNPANHKSNNRAVGKNAHKKEGLTIIVGDYEIPKGLSSDEQVFFKNVAGFFQAKKALCQNYLPIIFELTKAYSLWQRNRESLDAINLQALRGKQLSDHKIKMDIFTKSQDAFCKLAKILGIDPLSRANLQSASPKEMPVVGSDSQNKLLKDLRAKLKQV